MSVGDPRPPAERVGSALADVQARMELEGFGQEQAALRRVAELAASGVPSAVVLHAVADEASVLLGGAELTVVEHGPRGGSQRTEADVRPGGAHGVGPRQVCRVPLGLQGETWATLVATAGERPLPPGAAGLLAQFAHIATTAMVSTRSRDALTRVASQQAALRRVAELIAGGTPLEGVFDAVVREASSILGDTAAGLFRCDHDGGASVVARCRGFAAPVGLRLPPEVIDVLDPEGAVHLITRDEGPHAYLAEIFGVGEVVVVPIIVEGQLWGGLATTTPREPLPVDAEERLSEFAELSAAAVANAENKAKLRASRARLAVTADETRQRLQRDVHDGAQQRLVQTVLALKLGLDTADRGDDPVELMREALKNAELAMAELRDVVRGILPASLSRGGLRTGLESLIGGVNLSVDLDVSALPQDRLARDLEVTAYFVVAEALTNIVKHAGASRARVTVAATAELLSIEVTDDGRGGADPAGSGLTGLADRVEAANGALLLTSPPGVGTTVRVTLPRTRS